MDQSSLQDGHETMWTEEELRKNVGQLFIVGFHEQTPNDDIKALIQTHHVGAIVLFLRNVSSASQLLTLTQGLQCLAKESGHDKPLFIGIDQENGLVTRIKSPIAAQLPGPMALAAIGDANNAYHAAWATGQMLSYFGINMNYAPVADTNSEPKNPVIGVRSPSDDPEIIGRFVSAQVKAFREQGVISCIKHFPGHGDTAVDSHYRLPVIKKLKADLEECELVPFRRAIAEGVDSVMTAHIALPNLETDGREGLPASLSSRVTNILRHDLGFDGMVVSDCLEMDGVRKTLGTERGAVMALKAGTDCVMICHTMKVQVGAIEEVVQAVKSGELSQASIEASLARVERLKQKLPTWSSTRQLDTGSLDQMNLEHETLARKLYQKSTTVVRSSPGLLPLSTNSTIIYLSSEEAPRLTGVLAMSEPKTRTPYTPPEYYDILGSHCPSVTKIQYSEKGKLDAEMRKQIESADIVILATRNVQTAQYQVDFAMELGSSIGDKLIVIATCDPYDFLNDTSIIQNYITIYEPTIPAFESAANILFGVTTACGRLPVYNRKAQIHIKDFDKTADMMGLSSLWNESLPNWKISLERFSKLISLSSARHFVLYHDGALIGACLTHHMDEKHAKITAVIVSSVHQNRGLATALLRHARCALRQSMPQLKVLGIGSGFPRYWPGLPVCLPDKDRHFFISRGFLRTKEVSARDLYQDITKYKAPASILDRATKAGVTFAPWREDLVEECLKKQRRNFGHNADWIKAYEWIAATGQYGDVMVAFNSEGHQIGWTLMCSPQSAMCEHFAFLPLTGSKTGLIACVGVDAEVRKGGIGTAMLVSAIENMKQRGMDGVFIDWVVIRGFYEKLGFEVWREYEGYEWQLI